jgi:tripartite-type tricarboxylate transporter receptor subunit TctC
MQMIRIWLAALVALGSSTVTDGSVKAQDFYAGKEISLHIGFGSGGGYDAYSRLAARHFGRHVPGNPNVVPKNMPGAGGLKVANFMWRLAPKDGTALAMASEAIALEQMTEGPGTDYKADQFIWIGRMFSTPSAFFVWHTSPAKTIEDARKHESVAGGSGAGISYYIPRAVNILAGTKFKIVSGYTGSAEVELAMERQEVDGGFGLWSELAQRKPEWVIEKKIIPLYVIYGQRVPELPDVPTIIELATTGEGREIMKLLASTTAIGRSIFTTADVPGARVAQLRSAFIAMLEDPAFQADVTKSRLRLVEPIGGAELQKVVQDTFNFPKALLQEVKQISQH